MDQNRLHVAYTEHKQSNSRPLSVKTSRKEEIQATMERLWHQSPQQFDPQRDCMELQRIQNTIDAIKSLFPLSGKCVVDLGCGDGTISRLLRDGGAHVDAVDASTLALKKLKETDFHDITSIHDCLPSTSLKDKSYDLVVCTEVIAYLKPEEYRLLMAELARLVKNDGYVVCSTSLDINTEDPLDRFAALGETEFTFEKWVFNYHRLLIRLSRFAPFLKQNSSVMNFLERLCRFFWSDSGITHALFIGKRRPLTFPVKPQDTPRELKHKRQVWE